MLLTLASHALHRLTHTKKMPPPLKEEKKTKKAGVYITPNSKMRAKLIALYNTGERTYTIPGGLLFIEMPDPNLETLKTLISNARKNPKTLTDKQKKELAHAKNLLAAYAVKKLANVNGVHTEIINNPITFTLCSDGTLFTTRFPVIGTTYRRQTSQRLYGNLLPGPEHGYILQNKAVFATNKEVNKRFWEVQQGLVRNAATKKDPENKAEHTPEMDRDTVFIGGLGGKPAIDSHQPTFNKNHAYESGYGFNAATAKQRKGTNCSRIAQDSYLMAFELLLSAWQAYLDGKKGFNTSEAKKIFKPFGDQAALEACKTRVRAYMKIERSTSLPGKKQKLFRFNRDFFSEELGPFIITTKKPSSEELKILKTQTRYFKASKNITDPTQDPKNIAYYTKLMSNKQKDGVIAPIFFPKETPAPRSKKQLRKDLTRGALETLQYFITTQISEHPQITLALARYLLPSWLTKNTGYQAGELALTAMCLTKRNGLGDSVVGLFNLRQEMSNINTPILATPDDTQLHFG
jgi:hypothetical protein